MSKSIAQLYKIARKHLKLSQKKIAKDLDVSDVLISQIETGKTQSPNHEYTKYLVENGINYFYLAGLSNEIEGQLIEMVSKSKYEVLQADYEKLKLEKEALENQVSFMVFRSELEELTDKLKHYESIFKMMKN